MSASKANANGGFGGFLGVLFLIALIIKFIWWIVGAAVLVGLFFLGRAMARWYAKRSAEYARYSNALAARADEQHNWVLAGRRPRGLRRRRRQTHALFVSGAGRGEAPITRSGRAHDAAWRREGRVDGRLLPSRGERPYGRLRSVTRRDVLKFAGVAPAVLGAHGRLSPHPHRPASPAWRSSSTLATTVSPTLR